MKYKILNLGKQPIANGFLHSLDEIELFYNLEVVWDEDIGLLSLENTPDKSLLFNDHYIYRSSGSNTMRNHFKNVASKLSGRVLEIGSNDGVMVKNLSPRDTICVEPCTNMAAMTSELGYKTYPNFWNKDLATKILETHGPMDYIFAANCMCHIPEIDDAFAAVAILLDLNGVFIFEDPSMESMIKNISYDQLYDEHAHVFSIESVHNLLWKHGLYIHDVEPLTVHGGSNRYYVKKSKCSTVFGIKYSYVDLLEWSKKVADSRTALVNELVSLKKQNKSIAAIGATSKSTTIYNYCNIDQNLISYITDTTPEKQGLYSPGKHIPVVPPEHLLENPPDVLFLGAWNFAPEIIANTRKFLKKPVDYLTHVPTVGYYNS